MDGNGLIGLLTVFLISGIATIGERVCGDSQQCKDYIGRVIVGCLLLCCLTSTGLIFVDQTMAMAMSAIFLCSILGIMGIGYTEFKKG